MSGREKRIHMNQGMYDDLVDATAANLAGLCALDDRLRDLREQTAVQMRRQEDRLTARIDHVRREFDRRVGVVEQGLAQLQQQQARSAQLARKWLDAAAGEYDLIEAGLPHRQFAPDGLRAPGNKIEQAREGLRAQTYESAITAARDALTGLVELRAQIEDDRDRWTALRAIARSGLAGIDQAAEENAKVAAVDQEGTELPHMLSVDRWTGDGLTALRDRIAGLRARVDDDAQPITEGELREIIDSDLGELQPELVALVGRARKGALHSQMRFAVADRVLECLEAQHMQVKEDLLPGYENDDPRRAIVGDLLDPASTSYVLRVEQDPDAADRCVVILEPVGGVAPDSAEAEYVRMARLSELLNERGLPFSAPPRPGQAQPPQQFPDPTDPPTPGRA